MSTNDVSVVSESTREWQQKGGLMRLRSLDSIYPANTKGTPTHALAPLKKGKAVEEGVDFRWQLMKMKSERIE